MLAHFIYANDRLNTRKALGCLIGFAGVVVVNLGGGGELTFDFTLLGEGFVIIAAFVLAAASIYGKRLSATIDPMVMTGWQLFIGGVLLTGGFGSLVGIFFGTLTFAIVNQGIYFTTFDRNWSSLIIGIMLLLAVLMNNTFRNMALSYRPKKK